MEEQRRLSRGWTVKDVLNSKFDTLEFDGIWKDAIGCPEKTGAWMIYGKPKAGKTTFAMQLAKYMTNFGKAIYNSIEEGNSESVKMAYKRVDMIDVHGKIMLYCESIDDMFFRLSRHKSASIVFVDSVQFAGITEDQYINLKDTYRNKLFIFISHVEGNQPEGKAAKTIWRDSNVYFYVEGFRAFPTGRYEGKCPIDIDKSMADQYWSDKLK